MCELDKVSLKLSLGFWIVIIAYHDFTWGGRINRMSWRKVGIFIPNLTQKLTVKLRKNRYTYNMPVMDN